MDTWIHAASNSSMNLSIRSLGFFWNTKGIKHLINISLASSLFFFSILCHRFFFLKIPPTATDSTKNFSRVLCRISYMNYPDNYFQKTLQSVFSQRLHKLNITYTRQQTPSGPIKNFSFDDFFLKDTDTARPPFVWKLTVKIQLLFSTFPEISVEIFGKL